MIARVAVLGVALVVAVGGASAEGRVLEPDTVTLASDVVSGLPSAPVQARAAATWCGGATREDLAPNVVAGNPIHWIYAFPADGQDRMTELGSVMQTDAESIDSWWRSNDPARAPRNDVASFACGVQIDMSTLRLEGSSAALATSAVFRALFDELELPGDGGFVLARHRSPQRGRKRDRGALFAHACLQRARELLIHLERAIEVLGDVGHEVARSGFTHVLAAQPNRDRDWNQRRQHDSQGEPDLNPSRALHPCTFRKRVSTCHGSKPR